jgi:hypothetical protein
MSDNLTELLTNAIGPAPPLESIADNHPILYLIACLFGLAIGLVFIGFGFYKFWKKRRHNAAL